jgi:hypothetical protein
MSSKESDLTEKEKELIEKTARWIVNQGFEAPSVMFIQGIKPLATIGGDLALFFLAPFLPMLEEKGYDFIETFEKRENLERLIRRVEQLFEESKKEGKVQEPGFWRWLKNRFSALG